MRNMEMLGPAVYSTKYTPEGGSITTTTRDVLPKESFKGTIKPKETKFHETIHGVLADQTGAEVKLISIEPDATSEGRTITSHFSPIAAAGPDALGAHGTGWDMNLIRAHGIDEKHAGRQAKEILGRGNNKEKVFALAEELDRKRTLNGPQVKEVFAKVDEATRITDAKEKHVDIVVIKPDGKKEELKGVRTNAAEVRIPVDMLPGKEVDFAKVN